MQIRPDATVLILENDVIILRSTARILRREGYDVYEAETPGEARIIVDGLRNPIALLLCDLDLSGIYGRDAANLQKPFDSKRLLEAVAHKLHGWKEAASE